MNDLEERLRASAPAPSRGFDADTIARLARRRTRRQRTVVGGAAVVVLAVAVGMFSMVGRVGQASLDVVGPADPLARTTARSWVRLLGHAPAHASTGTGPVSIVDLDRAREQAGVIPLAAGPSDDEVNAQLRAILGASHVPLEPTGVAPGQLRAVLGFSQDQFDQVITGYAQPGGYIAVGRFDATAIRSAVQADPTWGPRLVIKVHRGLEYYSWGNDNALTADTSPVRPLGRGGRLVVGDGWLSWSFTDADAESTIDAFADPTLSLAADGWLREAVRAADTTQLTEIVAWSSPTWSTFPDPPASILALPAIDPPTARSGAGRRAGPGAVDQFVFTYATAAQATANREALEQTWKVLAPAASVEVTRQDAVLSFTLRAPNGQDLAVDGDTVDGTHQDLTAANYLAFFHVRSGQANRPSLPAPRPSQAEILRDGKVSTTEYEAAFWTFVECAEATGDTFSSITQRSNGTFVYTTDSIDGDRCYQDHFAQVDTTWQLAH